MTDSSTETEQQPAERHRLLERVIGAGILLLVAIIVIPLVLDGPHDVQNNGVGAGASGEVFSARPEPNQHNVNTHGQTGSSDGASSGIQVIWMDENGESQVIPAVVANNNEPDNNADGAGDEGANDAQADANTSTAGPDSNRPAGQSESSNASVTGSTDVRSIGAVQPQASDESNVASNIAPNVGSNSNNSNPAAVADDPAGTWQVQLGSFSSQSNAQVLRDRVREQQLPAYLVTSTVNGKTFYRVRLKPRLLLAEAKVRAAEVGEQLNLNASVVQANVSANIPVD